ncbi:MAG TPA: vanadium-dependent haloperoxidase [Thermoanaerobaculia bacterium]|nr:vanadium-dependent haloperoxidase [Thermoanaerobaculia bacterium]
MRARCFLLSLALLGSSLPAQADVVTDWNNLLLESIRAERTNPPRASRQMAILHTSIYDAVNGIVGGFQPYAVAPAAAPGSSPAAAAAAAGHAALVALYPARAATFDAAYAAMVAGIPDGTAKIDGIAWGETVAQAILDLRSDDGSAEPLQFESPSGAGWWIPTPPGYAAPLLPQWPFVTPWAMARGDQLRQSAPPETHTDEYTGAFREVFRLGRNTSPLRTAEQTQIAFFWDDGAGTQTPPGHWMEITQQIAAARGHTLAQNARLFALLGITVADAAIVAWDVKYAYGHWRPVTAIRAADTDGNPETHSDPSWSSLITTPPFPAYTSGHSTFSGSSARLLSLFFGTDTIAFSASADRLPGVVRNFSSLSQAAEEAGQSRIYGGIHWQYDNTAGLESGRRLAELVFFHHLLPIDGFQTAELSATLKQRSKRYPRDERGTATVLPGCGQGSRPYEKGAFHESIRLPSRSPLRLRLAREPRPGDPGPRAGRGPRGRCRLRRQQRRMVVGRAGRPPGPDRLAARRAGRARGVPRRPRLLRPL